jgi:hypothetical protein
MRMFGPIGEKSQIAGFLTHVLVHLQDFLHAQELT